jgi:hypothetical protein
MVARGRIFQRLPYKRREHDALGSVDFHQKQATALETSCAKLRAAK